MMWAPAYQHQCYYTYPPVPQQNHDKHQHQKKRNDDKKWIPELSSLANVVVSRCARILSLSVDQLQAQFAAEISDFTKDKKYASSFLEYCCFQTLSKSNKNRNHLKDGNFRRLSFDMMIAWEAPESAAESCKQNGHDPKRDDDGLFYSTLMPLLVTLKSTVGKQAFIRMAPAILGVTDVLYVHSHFDLLARPSAGRLTFNIYNNYLKELNKYLDDTKQLASLLNDSSLRREILVDIGRRGSVIQHLGSYTNRGRLILTDRSLYFEYKETKQYHTWQTFDLSENSNHILIPCASGPCGIPLFNRAFSYQPDFNVDQVVFEFPEFFGCTSRNYWLNIIQEIICAHKFVIHAGLEGAAEKEAMSRSIMSIIHFKATSEALRSNLSPKLFLYFSMMYASPNGNILLKFLRDRWNRGSQGSIQNTRERRLVYSKSPVCVLYGLDDDYQRTLENQHDMSNFAGDIFLDELPTITMIIESFLKDFRHVDTSDIAVPAEKVDSLSINLAILKAVLDSARPIGKWINSLLSWEEPLKTISFMLLVSSIIMRDLLQYVILLFVIGMAIFLVFFRGAGEGPLSGEVQLICSSTSLGEVTELRQSLDQLEQVSRSMNIFLLKTRALIYSMCPWATDQFILFLMLSATVTAILPGKVILLLLFWEVFTRQLPLRQETTRYYTRRLRWWWHHIPLAPIRFRYSRKFFRNG